MTPVLVEDQVEDLAEFGPFFALHTHSPSSALSEPWQLMRELVTAAARHRAP